MRILIIGGVAAGTKAAAKLKREDRFAEVTILTKGKEISYAGCGLPYYVGDVIHDKGQLIVNTPASFTALTGVEVRAEVEVTAVNRQAKTVEAVDLNTQEKRTYEYDKLVIATGADPICPPLPGMDLEGVYKMRTPDDAIALRERIEQGDVKRAVVVGAGFIGLEVAENLASQGIRVSVIDMAPQIMPPFDPEMAEYVENKLADHGIMCFTGTALQGIEGKDGKVARVLTSRKGMKADLAVLAIGIRANTAFLTDSGIEMMPNRTIKVNEYLQTNDENIYAIGDCACVTNRETGKPQWSPMGSSANIEGRIAAQNLTGKKIVYPGVLGTGVCKLPELNVGRTGLGEANAKEAGFDVITALSVVDDKAHYYPGAGSFIIKMLADKASRKFLGLQVIGKGAVDKVVDIAVTALSLGATVDQLENLDFAYAPPFSTAIHPFGHALNVLLNKMDGEFETFTPAEYKAGAADRYRVLDASPVPTLSWAPYVDLTKINGEIEGIGKDEKLLLVCAKGKRAYLTQNRMKAYGYTNTRALEGGLTFNEVEDPSKTEEE